MKPSKRTVDPHSQLTDLRLTQTALLQCLADLARANDIPFNPSNPLAIADTIPIDLAVTPAGHHILHAVVALKRNLENDTELCASCSNSNSTPSTPASSSGPTPPPTRRRRPKPRATTSPRLDEPARRSRT